MIDFLLYASINCQDAADMIGSVKANNSMSKIVRMEVVETIKDATPHCKWDAND